MKYDVKKWTLLFCGILCMALLVSCVPDSNVDEKAAKAMAEGFLKSYTPIKQESPAMSGEGKAFLADLTGDDFPEAVILYDDFHTSGAMVFDREGKELARFAASSFYNDANVTFSIYEDAAGKVLATRASCPSGTADGRLAVTEYFISFTADEAKVQEMFYIANETTGENEYFVSPQSSRKITRDEYLEAVDKILENSELLETIELKKEDKPIDLLKEKELETYIVECMKQAV